VGGPREDDSHHDKCADFITYVSREGGGGKEGGREGRSACETIKYLVLLILNAQHNNKRNEVALDYSAGKCLLLLPSLLPSLSFPPSFPASFFLLLLIPPTFPPSLSPSLPLRQASKEPWLV